MTLLLIIAVLLILIVPLFIWLLARKLFSRKRRSATHRRHGSGVAEFLGELGDFVKDLAD